MTAINLALRNLYGHVIWGNSLGNERRIVYRTGFNLRGFVREIPIGDCPVPVQSLMSEPAVATSPQSTIRTSGNDDIVKQDSEPPVPGKQLRLF